MRLIFFPGLGADRRMFDEQADLPGAEFPDWCEPGGTLSEFAERLAPTLKIDGPVTLVGFSFGGMVALELARLPELRPHVHGVAMIASCRDRTAITPEFKRQQALGSRLPKPMLAWGLRKLGDAFGFPHVNRNEHRETLRQIHGRDDEVIPLVEAHADQVIHDGAHLIQWSHPEEVNAFVLSVAGLPQASQARVS